MSLWNRIANVFKARANKAVEKLESQDLCAILEANLDTEKGNLRKAEAALNEVGGQKKSLEEDVTALQRSVSDWGHNAETALAGGKEDLARKALERQTHVEGELKAKQAALASVAAAHKKLTEDILAREEKVRDVEEQLKSLKAQEKAADITLKARETVGAAAGDGNAMDQIKVFEKRVQDKVHTAESATEFDAQRTGADVQAQFDQMAANTATDEKLKALKAKMASSTPAQA